MVPDAGRSGGRAISRWLHIASLLTVVAALLATGALAEEQEDLTEISTDLTEDELSDEFDLDEEEDVFPKEIDLSTLTFREKLALLRPRLAISQAFIINSDFGSQEVDTYITEVRGSVSVPLSMNFGVRLVGAADLSAFHFDGDNDFIYTGRTSGHPFDELVSNVFRLEGIYLVNDAWRLLGGGFMTSRFETGASYFDGIEGGGFAGVGYHLREDLSILLGLAMSSRMDRGGVGLAPIILVEWQVTDDIEVETEGLGVRVGVRLSDAFSLTVSTGYKGSRYRLEDRDGYVEPDDPASGRVGEGSLRDRRLHVAAGLTWKPSEHWRVRGSLGLVPYQKYTAKDHNGDTVDKAKIEDPAFASAITLEYRF